MTRVTIQRIRPKGGLMIDEKVVNRELDRVASAVANSMRRQANETVRTWEKKPNISTRRGTKGNQFFIILDINSIIWHYLDKGTKPHIIKAKNKPFLRFKSGGFVAKTKPGQFRANAGQAASGSWVSMKQVHHPGFPARGWSDEIKKRNEELASREMRKSLKIMVKSRKDK